MQTRYISHSQFDTSKMVIPRVDSRSMLQDEGLCMNNFQTMELNYQYDVDGNVSIAPLVVELPELYCPYGLYEKNGNAVIFTIFDMANPEQKQLCSMEEGNRGFWNQIYGWIVETVWKLRIDIPSMVRMPYKDAIVGMFPYHIFIRTNPNDGLPILSFDPTKYFDVNLTQQSRALFKVPIANPSSADQFVTLDWDQLKDKELKMIPLLTFKRICFIGGRIEIHMEITSAVITHIAPINSRSPQIETLKRLSLDHQLVQKLEEATAIP
jgi:hypothetical protein